VIHTAKTKYRNFETNIPRNVDIGAEAALFPEKEYINGIFVAVHFMHVARVLKS
jgi:hypothetical protein